MWRQCAAYAGQSWGDVHGVQPAAAIVAELTQVQGNVGATGPEGGTRC